MNKKMKKEDSKPISSECAVVIQEQQQYIKENLSSSFNYLFCARKPKGKYSKANFTPKSEVSN